MLLRVGIVGARRQAQGIGEYVARELAAHGAAVTAIVGTRPETVAAAQENLKRRFGLHVRGYLTVQAMLAHEPLEALAICSPHRFHREQLELALEGGVHTLCEKPLVFEEGRDPAADARRLAAGFAEARRVLMVNEQWPFTLPFFDRCWPAVRDPARPPHDLAMLLCPAEAGRAMIPNALPHALSLLLRLAPGGGEAREIAVRRLGEGGLEARFHYVHTQGETRVAVRLRSRAAQPRPAGYAIDGCGVRRVIEPANYRMAFEALPFTRDEDFWRFVERQEEEPGTSRLPLCDPLKLLVGEFLRRVETADETAHVDPTIEDNARLLAAIARAARGA